MKMDFLNAAVFCVSFQPALKLPGFHTLVGSRQNKALRIIRKKAVTQYGNVRHQGNGPAGTVAFWRPNYDFRFKLILLIRIFDPLDGVPNGNRMGIHRDVLPS